MKPCSCAQDPLQQSLRTRAAKLDRGYSIINRLLNANTDKIGKIVKNRPQAKYSSEPPALSILEQSEFSGDLDSENVSIRTRAPPIELRTASLGK